MDEMGIYKPGHVFTYMLKENDWRNKFTNKLIK
jgi:hypothetical protein